MIGKILYDAVLSLNPVAIRMIGGMVGHPVDPNLDDEEVIHRAAEIITFYMQDAPPEIKEHAVNILAMLGKNWTEDK